MLKQVIDLEGAVYIRYRLDGSLFNLRLNTHKKKLEQLFRNLLFTDDAALVAYTST